MNTKTERKLKNITKLWHMGQREEAARLILSLTKLQVFQLMVRRSEYNPDTLLWGVSSNYRFERFVESVLDKTLFN
jgi:hypothetical protein